jgi:hypothetical protein
MMFLSDDFRSFTFAGESERTGYWVLRTVSSHLPEPRTLSRIKIHPNSLGDFPRTL